MESRELVSVAKVQNRKLLLIYKKIGEPEKALR